MDDGIKNDINRQKVNFFRGELDNVKLDLSDLTSRTGVLMTIGGLLLFLPPLQTEVSNGYLSDFLIWTFPFFLLALIAYYQSATRVHSVIKDTQFAPKGTDVESVLLEKYATYYHCVWDISVKNYDNVLTWYIRTNALIYAYIFSLSINFYTHFYLRETDFCISFLIFILSCMLIIRMLNKTKNNSLKGKVI